MIFWALENGDDYTIAFFSVLLAFIIILMATVVLIDWIRKKWKK